MEIRKREALFYLTKNGVCPFEKWLENLSDLSAKSKIRVRIRRLELGNPGVYESVGEGVFELKIYFGPGYRIYFGEDGRSLVILLCGGDKSTQIKDIRKAKEYWVDYRRRK